jgi:hypothetical protein
MDNRFLEGLVLAAVFLIITWGVAMAAKWLVTWRKGALLGRIVSLFIWLCSLTLLLAIIKFGNHKDLFIAIQEFLNSFGSFVPKIFHASIGFLVGGMIAKIVRDSVATVNFDKWANLGGAEAVTGNSTISEIVSTIVFILLIVPVGIGALNVLDLPLFTGPVKNMLQIILNVFFGAVLIGAGVILARVLKGLVATAGGEGVAPALVNWLTIGLFVFIGIKQMNIGGQIVDYAFGAIAVGSAVAFVLAVGLGNREAIARKMNELIK